MMLPELLVLVGGAAVGVALADLLEAVWRGHHQR